MESNSTNEIYRELVKDLPKLRAIYCPICGNGPKRVAVNRKYKCRCGANITPSYTATRGMIGGAHLRVTVNEKNAGFGIVERIPFTDDFKTEDKPDEHDNT